MATEFLVPFGALTAGIGLVGALAYCEGVSENFEPLEEEEPPSLTPESLVTPIIEQLGVYLSQLRQMNECLEEAKKDNDKICKCWSRLCGSNSKISPEDFKNIADVSSGLGKHKEMIQRMEVLANNLRQRRETAIYDTEGVLDRLEELASSVNELADTMLAIRKFSRRDKTNVYSAMQKGKLPTLPVSDVAAAQAANTPVKLCSVAELQTFKRGLDPILRAHKKGTENLWGLSCHNIRRWMCCNVPVKPHESQTNIEVTVHLRKESEKLDVQIRTGKEKLSEQKRYFANASILCDDLTEAREKTDVVMAKLMETMEFSPEILAPLGEDLKNFSLTLDPKIEKSLQGHLGIKQRAQALKADSDSDSEPDSPLPLPRRSGLFSRPLPRAASETTGFLDALKDAIGTVDARGMLHLNSNPLQGLQDFVEENIDLIRTNPRYKELVNEYKEQIIKSLLGRRRW